ncbi:MAG: hypothetical protein ACREQW_05000 [Candidatus Binatia bacterium]
MGLAVAGSSLTATLLDYVKLSRAMRKSELPIFKIDQQLPETTLKRLVLTRPISQSAVSRRQSAERLAGPPKFAILRPLALEQLLEEIRSSLPLFP